MVAIDKGSASNVDSRHSGAITGLFLLFAAGERPTRDAVLHGISGFPKVLVSHDPAALVSPSGEGDDSQDWLELLIDGLTFDLIGLAPGPTLSVPEVAYRYGAVSEFDDADAEAIALVPGPHIVSGAHTLPVLRAMVSLGSHLADALPSLKAISWPPARTLVQVSAFQKTVSAWLEGGPFPALGLTGLSVESSGALRSDGLSFLIGQEIEIAPELAVDRVAATRLATRVIHELVSAGPAACTITVTGANGEQLRLEPTPDGVTVKISPA